MTARRKLACLKITSITTPQKIEQHGAHDIRAVKDMSVVFQTVAEPEMVDHMKLVSSASIIKLSPPLVQGAKIPFG